MFCILFYMILFSCLSNGIYHLGGLCYHVISSLSDISVSFSALTSGSMMKISHSDLLYKVVIHVYWSYKWSFLRQFYTFKNWSSQICINKQFYSSKRLFSSHSFTLPENICACILNFIQPYAHNHYIFICSAAVDQSLICRNSASMKWVNDSPIGKIFLSPGEI